MSDKIDRVVTGRMRAGGVVVAGVPPGVDGTWPAADLIQAVEACHLEPTEPIFCLRGSDRAAAPTIYFWTAKAEQLGASPDTTNRVLRLHDEVVEWQSDPANSLAVKVPT